jgi:hypothetical protein
MVVDFSVFLFGFVSLEKTETILTDFFFKSPQGPMNVGSARFGAWLIVQGWQGYSGSHLGMGEFASCREVVEV